LLALRTDFRFNFYAAFFPPSPPFQNFSHVDKRCPNSNLRGPQVQKKANHELRGDCHKSKKNGRGNRRPDFTRVIIFFLLCFQFFSSFTFNIYLSTFFLCSGKKIRWEKNFKLSSRDPLFLRHANRLVPLPPPWNVLEIFFFEIPNP
jgi:hypothetical protein